MSASSLSSRVSWMVENVILWLAWLAPGVFGGGLSSISPRSIMSRTKANSSSSSNASFLPCDKAVRTVSDNSRSFEAFLLGSLVIYFFVLFPPYPALAVCSQPILPWPDTLICKHHIQTFVGQYQDHKALQSHALRRHALGREKNGERNTDQPVSLIQTLASLLLDQSDSFVDALGRVADLSTGQWEAESTPGSRADSRVCSALPS